MKGVHSGDREKLGREKPEKSSSHENIRWCIDNPSVSGAVFSSFLKLENSFLIYMKNYGKHLK